MILSHRKLSAWYQQLAQNLDAGVPLAQALRLAHGTGPPAEALGRMADAIEGGGSVDDALRGAQPWLPWADVLALSAAAAAGRMPRTLHNLSVRHAQFGTATIRLILACVYPLGILHLALLLLPIMRMIDWERGFQWNGPAYVRALFLSIVPLWSVGLTVWWLARRRSPLLARVSRLLPALRGYVRAQALADFAFALGNFLEAGLPIGQAWAAAGLITRSPDLSKAASAMEMTIGRGEAPGPKLSAWPCFPPDFVALYRTGENTGQLDANLLRLAGQYQEEANRSLGIATILYPVLMFLVAAGFVIYFVFSVYGGYLKMLGKLAG